MQAIKIDTKDFSQCLPTDGRASKETSLLSTYGSSAHRDGIQPWGPRFMPQSVAKQPSIGSPNSGRNISNSAPKSPGGTAYDYENPDRKQSYISLTVTSYDATIGWVRVSQSETPSENGQTGSSRLQTAGITEIRPQEWRAERKRTSCYHMHVPRQQNTATHPSEQPTAISSLSLVGRYPTNSSPQEVLRQGLPRRSPIEVGERAFHLQLTTG